MKALGVACRVQTSHFIAHARDTILWMIRSVEWVMRARRGRSGRWWSCCASSAAPSSTPGRGEVQAMRVKEPSILNVSCFEPSWKPSSLTNKHSIRHSPLRLSLSRLSSHRNSTPHCRTRHYRWSRILPPPAVGYVCCVTGSYPIAFELSRLRPILVSSHSRS